MNRNSRSKQLAARPAAPVGHVVHASRGSRASRPEAGERGVREQSARLRHFHHRLWPVQGAVLLYPNVWVLFLSNGPFVSYFALGIIFYYLSPFCVVRVSLF